MPKYKSGGDEEQSFYPMWASVIVMKLNLYFGHEAESCFGTLMTVVSVNCCCCYFAQKWEEALCGAINWKWFFCVGNVWVNEMPQFGFYFFVNEFFVEIFWE